jgi:NAD(P)-dependent dehydrogenase (short-subunit alcohol dehydrogenase family)
VALVTGGSRGIGRAIAVELAATHRVLATYRGNREAAESLMRETGCETVQSDISSAADREALGALIGERFGRLDLLVNNAGIAPRERRDILESSEASFDELVGTNLKGPYFLTQMLARRMLGQTPPIRGRIVFVTSISAFTASVNRAEYCVSKAGLSMAARTFAQRLAAEGIPVIEVRPGIIRTDMIAAVEKAYDDKIAGGLLPQRRMGEGVDVARAVRAVASGLLDYSTGEILHVDGGFQIPNL